MKTKFRISKITKCK